VPAEASPIRTVAGSAASPRPAAGTRPELPARRATRRAAAARFVL